MAATNATQVRIDALGTRMETSLDEIKGMISSFDERLRKVESADRSYQELLASMNKSLDRGLDDIKGMISAFDHRLRSVETQEASYQPLIESKITAAFKKIDKHDEQLIILQKTVTDLSFVVYRMEGVARWIMGVITALVIAILIAVMTGKVTLLFG
jgi:hypothetical protein